MPISSEDLSYLTNLSRVESPREIFRYVSENPEKAWMSEICRAFPYAKATTIRYLKILEQKHVFKVEPRRRTRPEKMKIGEREITRLATRWELIYNVDETPEAKEFKKLLKK